jgi:hypothetical protein
MVGDFLPETLRERNSWLAWGLGISIALVQPAVAAKSAVEVNRIAKAITGQVTANRKRVFKDSYALLYSNDTLPGMSGGPVLNSEGKVVGSHGIYTSADSRKSGNKTRKREPVSTWLTTKTVPPQRSSKFFTTVKPNPAPLWSLRPR